jgi:hypothetical protein
MIRVTRAKRLLDSAFDAVVRHIVFAPRRNRHPKPRIGRRISSTTSNGNDNLAPDFRENLSFSGILRPLAVHDVLKLRMSCHCISP